MATTILFFPVKHDLAKNTVFANRAAAVAVVYVFPVAGDAITGDNDK